jgi:hypothetical protein
LFLDDSPNFVVSWQGMHDNHFLFGFRHQLGRDHKMATRLMEKTKTIKT